MSMQLPNALATLLVGIVATALLDGWALALKLGLGLPTTNWGLVGRWVAGMSSGQFRVAATDVAPVMSWERAVGWTTHYLIGVIYAAAYLVIATLSGGPGLPSALAFGAATVFAPWLILQPGLGLGRFASEAARPNRTRVLNLLAHLVFGAGLYLGCILVGVAFG